MTGRKDFIRKLKKPANQAGLCQYKISIHGKKKEKKKKPGLDHHYPPTTPNTIQPKPGKKNQEKPETQNSKPKKIRKMKSHQWLGGLRVPSEINHNHANVVRAVPSQGQLRQQHRRI